MYLIHSYLDAVNSDDLNRVEPLLADDIEWTSPGGKASGRQGTRKHMEKWFGAFPDLKLELVSAFDDENQGVAVCKMIGTHQNTLVTDFGQFPPTGKRINVDLVNAFKFKDGKISAITAIYDTGTILQQLGIGAQRRAA